MSGSDKLFQPEPLPNEVIDAISDLSNEQKAKWNDHVLPKAPISSFSRELEKHRIARHRGPILQAIVSLPSRRTSFISAAALTAINTGLGTASAFPMPHHGRGATGLDPGQRNDISRYKETCWRGMQLSIFFRLNDP